MNSEWLKRKQKIEERYNEWFSYNIGFEGKSGFLTKPNNKNESVPLIFFERIVSCVQDMLKKPLAGSSVLDLGCMEGIASFAFAKCGAGKIVGVDGREANIAKAEFIRETFGFENIAFKAGDVRDLNFNTGSFDIVLALGILYHLDAPDLFYFIENMFKWTKRITIIDTHIAFLPKLKYDFKGKQYSGLYYKEFVPNETDESSIGNDRSFWLTRSSLFNILTRVGYTGIYECKYPRGGSWREFDDRLTIIATKEPRRKYSIFRSKDIKQPDNFEERDPRVVLMEKTNFPLD